MDGWVEPSTHPSVGVSFINPSWRNYMTRAERKEKRRSEALARNKDWAMLDAASKLLKLKERGHGRCKQAYRLRMEVALEAMAQSNL